MSFRPEDVRALAELAETIEDRTPHEQAALDRVRTALTEHEQQVNVQLDKEATEQLRAEVQAAYDAWQQHPHNDEVEDYYFEKLTELDWNLAARGLERGETLDQEIPLQSLDRSLDRSLQNRGRDDR